MNNKLAYLGFLGLIGLIGLKGNFYFFGFFGFFGFFVYFGYFKVIPDELFKENVRKAATPSFFISIVLNALISGYIAILKNASPQDLATSLSIGLAINFALPIFVFTGILVYREIAESSGGE
ncbi:MAG: DUF3796 domain-containing protein [Clostridiaceae bacterium]|nr:DUF3796 domain-containing protein [Clostridiaceae bacterium]